ncbi:conserved hypothetical protein [Theileria equi strain WA]|uniref:Uncharacterized protein n=1 Tax=Theileria equi strain WA TaxID=1537102 RepID=L1LEI5_THEEQ|nr:conserved hypothetical protein [Theileria equi strain WA]EKX73588.1 conserved hypothetical protein [Theileria equi strain WA]|eukprot:XP_004833040.1 conserved hypothetical protein [Theileria equi strain WA]
MTRRSRSSSRRRGDRDRGYRRSPSPYRGHSRHRYRPSSRSRSPPRRWDRPRSERDHFSRHDTKSHNAYYRDRRYSRFSDTHENFRPDHRYSRSYAERPREEAYGDSEFKVPSLDFRSRDRHFPGQEPYRTPRESHYKTPYPKNEPLSSENATQSSHQGRDTTQLPEKNAPKPVDDAPKEEPVVEEKETTWKGFPVPKPFRDNETFYETRPKIKFRDVLAPLYMPKNGPKLKRYKNFQIFSDILEKCNKARAIWRDDIERTIVAGFKVLEEKLKLSRIRSELDPIVNALRIMRKRDIGGGK